MALVVATWIWGNKYGSQYINRLRYGIQKNLKAQYRFVVFNPLSGDQGLEGGCLCRLRMFSPSYQHSYGILPGDQIICLDLDIVITGSLDPVFDRGDETFTILSGANAANPCPFNGSIMSLRAGRHIEVWNDFTLDRIQNVPFYEFPDDQGWIHHKLPNARTWRVGKDSGIYAFKKPGWPPGDSLPDDARLVCFPGKRDPSQFMHLQWIKKYWC